MDVSRETEERLRLYLELVARWNTRINLVSKSSLDDGWQRHIVDSAQLFGLAPANWTHWVDLGSGAGLPGAVVAIIARAEGLRRRVTLVESDARKAAFLRTALRETATTADVVAERIEEIPPLEADIVSARALAPLPKLLGLVSRHLRYRGTALLPKGRSADREVEEALEQWTFACEKIASKTDPGSVILKIGEIGRV